MKRLLVLALFLALLGFLAYATLVPHAERPCLVTPQDRCTKALIEEKR